MSGKASVLDQNPLVSATTIPEANWNRRWMKRAQNAASDSSPLVQTAVALVQQFLQNIQRPEFDYLPDMVEVLRFIRRIDMETPHKQLAMELTNYVKKLVRRYRGLSDLEARALEEQLTEGIEESNVMNSIAESSHRADALSRAVGHMTAPSSAANNANLEAFMREHGSGGSAAEAEAVSEANNANLEAFMREHGNEGKAVAEAEPSNANLEAFMREHGNEGKAVAEAEPSNANLASYGLARANWNELVASSGTAKKRTRRKSRKSRKSRESRKSRKGRKANKK